MSAASSPAGAAVRRGSATLGQQRPEAQARPIAALAAESLRKNSESTAASSSAATTSSDSLPTIESLRNKAKEVGIPTEIIKSRKFIDNAMVYIIAATTIQTDLFFDNNIAYLLIPTDILEEKFQELILSSQLKILELYHKTSWDIAMIRMVNGYRTEKLACDLRIPIINESSFFKEERFHKNPQWFLRAAILTQINSPEFSNNNSFDINNESTRQDITNNIARAKDITISELQELRINKLKKIEEQKRTNTA